MVMSNGKHEFKFTELFINKDGKTSGSGFIGILMGLIGCLAFVAAIVGFFLQLPDVIPFMQQTIFFIGAATVLLGVRKVWGKDVSENESKPLFQADPNTEEKG